MTEELKVVLRRSEHSGFGFSLLGTTGPPHVIYDIVENSPAADCGEVEAGDVIVKVNGTDVHRYTTKEVLKCLRLSDDLVTLELKRDPKLKARIKEQLANTKGPHYVEIESQNIYDYKNNQEYQSYQSATQRNRYDTHNSVDPISSTSNSPAQRYISPTHLPLRPTTGGGNTTGNSSVNHSRNSSASSAKIQIIETNTGSGTSCAATAASTSPTCRPSRIPTALKSQPKPAAQQSPQHKRPKPSQIPTKASPATNGNTVSAPIGIGNSGAPLQHSNSYSGGGVRQQQQHQRQERDPEPISAPPQPAKAPRFEAYMMTGDLILNLSRTSQSSNLLPGHTKKVDSLLDSPIRAPTNSRTNGAAALAPRASGESSPTSSSSIDSPSHVTSYDSENVQKQQFRAKTKRSGGNSSREHHSHHILQQQRDSINNSYNNSNSGEERHNRRDSLTNDTLLLCEELEQDEEDEEAQRLFEAENEFEQDQDQDNNSRYQRRHNQQEQKQQQQRYQYRVQYHREHNLDEELDLEENEEDQTPYDITNIETYNSGGVSVDIRSSERQCLVKNYGSGANDEDDEYSTNSLTSAPASTSARQRLRALKQQQKIDACKGRHGGNDSVDCAHYGSGSGSGSSATVKSDGVGVNTSQEETSFSVPTSPISLSTPVIDKETANSVPTSPEPSSFGAVGVGGTAGDTSNVVRRHNGIVRKCDSAGFRTSKSEDHLQQAQRDGIAAVIPIDIDEDVNSSLNTLLDTRQDSEDSQASNRDRIVWTYNAPLLPHQLQQLQQQQQYHHSQYPAHYGHSSSPNSHSHSHSSSISSSPQHSAGSPASPTSVSSSVMSSSGSKGALGITGSLMYVLGNNGGGGNQQQQIHQMMGSNATAGAATAATTGVPVNSMGLLQCPPVNGSGGSGTGVGGGAGGDQSVSEAISNMSSPDYQDDDNLLSSRDILGGMILSDPSDSDSTILVSDAQRQHQQHQQQQHQQPHGQPKQQLQPQKSEHKLVIQVRGIDSSNSTSPRSANSELKDSEDELVTLTEETSNTILNNAASGSNGSGGGEGFEASPPVSDDGSDVESLHSYHYSPKAVDMPSAIRLAKRLFSLDGFKKSDVSRHLSKNNDFSRAVADEYLKYFSFEKKTLDQSLREFLQQFSLSGETQERERVLVHFSKRFLDCNPGAFNSQDAVHTLTCAIMLLNTDLHGQNIGRKMTCSEFIENLAELNDGENFPKDVLKYLYQAIKTQPLEWALDDDAAELQKQCTDNNMSGGIGGHGVGQNPFLDLPETSTAVEYKKGYVMRKCCYDSNYNKTPFGKRSWKMFYCTLRDLVLFLHKDEHGFRKSQMSDNLHNAIRIHHALATKATDYTKKQHVFRLQTADQAEYLFQTSDSKELQSWVETINFVCAAYSAPPFEGGVGSQKRFQRPLLPSTHTKLLMKEQLESHEQQVDQLENTLMEHKKGPSPNKGLPLQNYKEKENYLQHELRRYKTYVSILSAKLLADQQQMELQQLTQDEESDTFPTGVGTGQRLQTQSQTQPQQQSVLQANNIVTGQQQQQQVQLQQQQQQSQQSSNSF